MTTSTPVPDTPRSARRDRSVVLLIAAAVLVLLVVTLVLVFGVRRPPDLPTVAESPEPAPSASIAWTSWRDGECVEVAAPDGEVRRPYCRDQGYGLDGWSEEGLLVRDWGGDQRQRLIVDPETGEVLATDSPTEDPARSRPEPGPAVQDHRSNGELVVEDDRGTQLWRVESPERYRLRTSARSPDGRWIATVDSADRLLLLDAGRWIATVDSADRLLLLDANGELPPRVWATGVDSYGDLVWESS